MPVTLLEYCIARAESWSGKNKCLKWSCPVIDQAREVVPIEVALQDG